MRNFFLALILFVSSHVALAQQDAPPAPVQDATPDAKRVLIIGDQLAGGMGAGLARMVQDRDNIEIINRFNESSGLARPEIYDWAAAIPKMTEDKNISTAIILMGLNDRRDIKLADKVLKFGSPEWNALYQQRVDGVIDALAAQHIQVLWMGEPPMGDPALDADMQNLTAIVQSRVAAKGAGFIDLRTPLLNAQGGYTDHGPDETGVDRRLREGDGVTFLRLGNNKLGQIALAALNSNAAPVVGAAPPQVNAPTSPVANAAPVSPVPAPVNNGPIFGQEGMEDLNAAAAQGSKALSAAVEQDKVVKEAQAASSIGIGAVPGSNAEALFTTGLAGTPPAGRFDDFSVKN